LRRKKISIEKLDFAKGNGLIPVVVQDVDTKEVLMLAYTDVDALKRTLETGKAHYWSRSRQKLWMKGETSGNVQKIKDIIVDCDYDALLFIVEQKGNACHTGERTCFHNELAKNKHARIWPARAKPSTSQP
jgi:phosphoribosyl-AMP cyclohydrolase